MSVVLETTIGDMTIDLFTEERPHSCKNFLKLCKLKYYNFCVFHHIQENFVAQTGDPTGTGTGGESVYGIISGKDARYYEGEKKPKIKHDRPGLVSMVHCGNNLVGSQFFITLGEDTTCSLDEHIVFGEIAEGQDVLLKLNETICDVSHRPYQDIRITHTVILEDPYSDPDGLTVPDRSPEPPLEVLQSDRIGADEDITEDVDVEVLEEKRREKEAQARATILEIVGDLPSADIAPPENVLFICKLNPVTSDDDLQIIFSRFGKIVSCEVIRDKKSGNSLQYAFVEFDNQKSCEEAYLKMDNVLIDDRRIHVDFSQSVSKIKWLGKGRGVKYSDKDDEGKNISDKYSKYRNKKKNNEDTKFNYIREKISKHESERHRKDDRHYRNRENENEEGDRRIEREDKYRRNDREDKDKRRDKDEKMRKNYKDERDRENYRNERDDKNQRSDKSDRDRRSNRDERDRRSVKSDREKRKEGSDKNEKEYRRDNGDKKRSSEQNGDRNSKKPNSNHHDSEPSKQKQKCDEPTTKKSSKEKYNNNDDEISLKNTTKRDEKKSPKNGLKKKRRDPSSSYSSSSSSSSSSSDSSSSSSTSSSSSSTSSFSRGAKVVKYYDKKGKLVKVVKNQKSSSDSDRKHKKRHRKKIVKVYKSVKRKRKSVPDSTNSSSSESENDRKKRRKKQSYKKGKKIKGND